MNSLLCLTHYVSTFSAATSEWLIIITSVQQIPQILGTPWHYSDQYLCDLGEFQQGSSSVILEPAFRFGLSQEI